jgi:hypothetical protein
MKTTMKGLVYGGPGKIELKEIPVPTLIKPTVLSCYSLSLKTGNESDNRKEKESSGGRKT